MSSRPDGSKERSRGRTKMKAAATVAGTAAGEVLLFSDMMISLTWNMLT